MNSHILLHRLKWMQLQTQFLINLKISLPSFIYFTTAFSFIRLLYDILQQPTHTHLHSLVRSSRLLSCPCNTSTEKNSQVSDKCTGGGILWPHTVFSCVVLLRVCFVRTISPPPPPPPPPPTSSWPHLRCDVGLEEGEYK